MGSSICYHAERRTARGWERCTGDRTGPDGQAEALDFRQVEHNLGLFSILVGAERLTTGGFEPIAPPRGLPADSLVVGPMGRAPATRLEGTWLTVKELLDFPWHDKSVACSGYVDAENFLGYRIDGRPRFAHPRPLLGVRVVSNDKMERLITEGTDSDRMMTLISFGIPCTEFVSPFLTETLPLLRRLGEPEDVRLVLSWGS